MCKELRNASRREMRAFIEGRPIPEKSDGNVVEILSPEEKTVELKPTEVPTHLDNSLKRNADTATFRNSIQHKPSEHYRIIRRTEAATESTNSISNDFAVESSSSKAISHPPPARQSPSASCASSKRARKIDPKWTFSSVYKSGPVPLDPNTSGTWIYPRHEKFPMRQYQLEISETAVLYNTLVSLPTGLGKTLIAAVVLHNYYRWFPEGKVIFLAPTLPLVSQQAEACYNIMGIPEKDTAVLTGRIKPCTRFDLWRSRRVFYCTPQTVQRDLLSNDGTSFASKVCCVVLDEAHKASGDYAYTKVIEQLELAGAQFRIVGLSATPGTSIKAIQKVVESLRAVKIEARHDTDPSVTPYIHQKHSEIVIVPKNESQKDIERRLTQLLEPVLQYLKAHGALRFGGGNATVTTFQIHKSCQEYLQRNGNASGSVRAYFQAAYKLIELRNDAYQSLGCVKLKIQRLKHTPQRGVLAKMIRSKDFDALHQRVLEATDSATDSKTGSEPSVESFNPKLQKLAELLNEHFCRAKAAEKSSRAIVFSQFRDSVSEIVEQLKMFHPLVRARHFVGQQGSKRPVGDVDNRLGGMKQSEQQQVIKWFRENVYNVLVCTCIGEEGLDIGEVDLIVNFDTLRSPIRMIQRTGRTGRKRDGRVVCLISEGQEERTYKASKQAEQTLMIALKKCGSFKMAVHKPILPREPSREFTEIKITGSFRLSQVGHSAPRRQTKVQNWNLSSAQEEERSQLLGKITPANSDWKTVRAVLLRGWCGNSRATIRGQSTQVLHKLMGVGPVKAELVSRRSLTCGTESIFPIIRQHETESVAKSSVQMVPLGHEKKTQGESHMPNASALRELNFRNRLDEVELKKGRVPSLHTNEKTACEKQEDTALNLQDNQFRRSNTASAGILEKRHVGIQPMVQQPDLLSETVNYNRSIRGNEAHHERPNADHDDLLQPAFRLPTPPPSSCEEDNGTPAEERAFCFRLPTQDSSSSEDESPKDGFPPSKTVETHEPSFDEIDSVTNITHFQVHQTHRREHDDQSERSKHRTGKLRPGVPRHPETDDSDSPLISFLKRRTDESDTPQFCLQKKDTSDTPLISLQRKAEDRPLIELKRRRKKSINRGASVCGKTSIATSGMEDSMASGKNANRSGDLKMPSSAILCAHPSDMESETVPEVQKGEDSRLSSQENCPASREADLSFDNGSIQVAKPLGNPRGHSFNGSPARTPTANRNESKRFQKAPSGLSLDSSTCVKRPGGIVASGVSARRHDHAQISRYGELTDTPECNVHIDPEYMICAICCSGASADENPIVLCDGSCNRGFHKFCCSIEFDLDSTDPWLCQECSKAKESLPTKRIIKKGPIRNRSDNQVVDKRVGGYERDDSNVQRKKRRLERLHARRLGAAKFVLDEAEIEANGDTEGEDSENDMLEALEEEESTNDSFINDSTQLTQDFSDDELGNADPDASHDVDFHHRHLHAQFDRKNQFKTPVLNRRAMGGRGVDLSETSSQEGLGNMHFVRSVLQHHQQGGNAQEIEAYFRDLQAREQSPGESSSIVDRSDSNE